MANAGIDENSRPTATAVLNTDGETIVRLMANPTTHVLVVSDGTTGDDNGGEGAFLDENSRPTLFAKSSDGDGALVSLYADTDGRLLIDSN